VAKANFSDLRIRVGSAAVLLSIAVLDLWMGGLYVIILVMLGAALMLWEYRRFFVGKSMRLHDPALVALSGGGAAAIVVTGLSGFAAGAGVVVATAIVAGLLDRNRFGWMLAGGIYIGLAMALLVEIRGDEARGIPVVAWLVCIVIAADVGGYFAGKTLGGPKLMPRVSPNKTWSGTLGGLFLALLVGTAFWHSGTIGVPSLIVLSGVIAAASQSGDLLESWLKRRYGVKDSSSLIPGHGGLLDRFDGLLGALWIYGVMDLTGFLGV